jgi:hypothetical protein
MDDWLHQEFQFEFHSNLLELEPGVKEKCVCYKQQTSLGSDRERRVSRPSSFSFAPDKIAVQ